MTNEELLKRADDLASRAEKTGSVTHTAFLTPAEQYVLRGFRPRRDCRMVFSGGVEGAERRCAFFLPDWMDEADFDPSETIRCIRITAHFGAPGHRDYLGALLGAVTGAPGTTLLRQSGSGGCSGVYSQGEALRPCTDRTPLCAASSLLLLPIKAMRYTTSAL